MRHAVDRPAPADHPAVADPAVADDIAVGHPVAAVRRRRGRRALAVGLALSAMAHLLGVVIYSFSTAPLIKPVRPVSPLPLPSPGGIEIVRIVEVDGSLPGDPSDPTEIESPPEPEVVPELPTFEDDFLRFPERYRSAAERLRAGPVSARLWRALDSEPIEPTPEEALELRLLAAIEEMNDSAAAQAERERAVLDWTHTDEDGGKWGVTPGRLHLGDISIPLPFGFGPPPDYSGDRAEMSFRLSDIDRAAGSLAARQSWKERAEVMRRRREARRRAELEARAENEEEESEKEGEGEEGKPPPVIKPDTTRSR